MSRSRHIRIAVHPSGNSKKPNTRIGNAKVEWVCKKLAEVLMGWRGVCWFGFLVFSFVS